MSPAGAGIDPVFAINAVVSVVDDDPSVLRGLQRLLMAHGLEAETFSSAAAFLAAPRRASVGCLVLDVRLPDLNGLEIQRLLAERNQELPIVFITGHGDISMSVRAMKAGAIDFLTKPFTEEALLEAISLALKKSRARLAAAQEAAALAGRLASLSSREVEVLREVVAGKLYKQIAADLGIAERTVKLHRARISEKLGVRAVADLVRLAEKVGL